MSVGTERETYSTCHVWFVYDKRSELMIASRWNIVLRISLDTMPKYCAKYTSQYRKWHNSSDGLKERITINIAKTRGELTKKYQSPCSFAVLSVKSHLTVDSIENAPGDVSAAT